MTAFADFTINDGKATPVAHTFKARRIDGAVAKWQDISGGIAVGFPTITLGMREPVKGSHNYRAEMRISVPVLETVSNSTVSGIAPAPIKAYSVDFHLTMIAPERSDVSVRKDAIAFLKNVLSVGQIGNALQDLDFVS